MVKKTESGGKKITLISVAKAAGISPSAVYAFANGKLYKPGAGPAVGLSEATQERILEAMRKVRYVPADPQLRQRVYPEQGDVCFLLDRHVAEGIANTYHGAIFDGAAQELAERGKHASFCLIDSIEDYLEAPDQLPAIIRNRLANRFITSGRPNYSLLTVLERMGLPVVHISRHVEWRDLSCVVPDFESAGELAIRHLLDLGHREIAVMAPPYMRAQDYNARLLLRGAAKAFAASGISFSEEQVIFSRGDASEPYEGWLRLRALPTRPTAVFGLDDYTALRVLRSAHQDGVRLPEELSVIGCNGEARNLGLGPRMATIQFPLREMGREAVRVLLNDAPLAPGGLLMLPVRLDAHESTAPRQASATAAAAVA